MNKNKIIPVIGHHTQNSLHCKAIHVHTKGLGDGRDVADLLLAHQEMHHNARQHRCGPQQITDYKITNQYVHGSVQVLVYDNDAQHHTVCKHYYDVAKQGQEEQEGSEARWYIEALQLEHNRLLERYYHCYVIHPKQRASVEEKNF